LPQFFNGGGLVGYEVVDEEYFSVQHIVFDRGFNGALIALIGKHFHLYPKYLNSVAISFFEVIKKDPEGPFGELAIGLSHSIRWQTQHHG
jgi:hypothetical protein